MCRQPQQLCAGGVVPSFVQHPKPRCAQPTQHVLEGVVTKACLAMTEWCHAGFIKQKGRIAISELAAQTCRLVDLESKQVT